MSGFLSFFKNKPKKDKRNVEKRDVMHTDSYLTKIEPYLKFTQDEEFFEGASLAQEELQKSSIGVQGYSNY